MDEQRDPLAALRKAILTEAEPLPPLNDVRPPFSGRLDVVLRARVLPLVEVAQTALLHIAELEEAWQRGAISEHDGHVGVRSSRNVDVDRHLRAALRALTGEEAK